MNQTFNFEEKIESIKHLLKPPVGNKCLFNDMMTVMVVGGPNQREEYHIEEGEELFYQLKGFMNLNIIEKGIKKCITINQGEMFLLPARIPHSPQRFPDTMGLVWERKRINNEYDGLRWYVNDEAVINDTKISSSSPSSVSVLEVLYEEYFHCTDLGTQLKPIIEKFTSSDNFKTRIPVDGMPLSDPPVEVDIQTQVNMPFLLSTKLGQMRELLSREIRNDVISDIGENENIIFDSQFKVLYITNNLLDSAGSYVMNINADAEEIFLWYLPPHLRGGDIVMKGKAASSNLDNSCEIVDMDKKINMKISEGQAVYLQPFYENRNSSDDGNAVWSIKCSNKDAVLHILCVCTCMKK